MGAPKKPKPGKLFCGVIASDVSLLPSVEIELERALGRIETKSPLLPFAQTDYYAPEMGKNLSRIFYSFKELLDKESVAHLKLKSNEIERVFALPDGARRVNIDPGYVTQAKVVLLTTKNFSHRIYVGEGIFAEITMSFAHGKWIFYPYTYPDYRQKCYFDFFDEVRIHLLEQLRP